jgi:flagellar protein FliJ
MGQYSFHLEKVLEWREGEEKSLTDKLARKSSEMEDCHRTLERLKKEYREEKLMGLRRTTASEMNIARLYESKLDEEISHYRESLETLKRAVEEIRKELVESRKNTKTMEKLKEKDFASFQVKMKYREQKFLDEFGTSGFAGFQKES